MSRVDQRHAETWGVPRFPRNATTEISDQLIERAGENVDVWGIALHDTLRDAGLEDGERYYVRLTVVELVPVDDAEVQD